MKKLLPSSSVPDKWRPGQSAEARPSACALTFDPQRKEHIARLEALRDSKVIVLFERGEAPNSPLRYLYEHLRSLDRQAHRRLSLVLYTRRGGEEADVDRALGLMALVREHAREVEVLVPNRAWGLGTLLAVGADRVLLHPLATVGRLDHAGAMLPAQHFMAWLGEAGPLDEAARQAALLALIQDLGPRPLAQAHLVVERLRAGIRELINGRVRPQDADNQPLLELLSDPTAPLTRPLDRRRARAALGLPQEGLDADTEAALWALFCDYERPLALSDDLNVDDRTPLAVIESAGACHAWLPGRRSTSKLSGTTSTPDAWIPILESALH